MIKLSTTLSFLFVLGTCASGGEWPSWRGPDGNGISPESKWSANALANGAKILWQVELGRGYSAVAVKDGKVYSMGNDGTQDIVRCLDAETGKHVWKYGYACNPGGGYKGPRATPVLNGPAVFTYSQDGQLHCLKAASGELMWRKDVTNEFGATPPKWNHSGSPLVVGQLLILNAGQQGLALRKQTGEKVWGGKPGKCGYASPVLFQAGTKPAVAVFGEKDLQAVDAVTGRLIWTFPWETKYDVNAADPVLTGDDGMFISSGYGRGCALLDLSSGKPRKVWENKSMSNHFSTSISLAGYIYGIDGNAGRGKLKCLDLKTGDVKWEQDTGFGSILCADGKLIILNDSGKLIIAEASPSGYRELASAQTPLTKTCWTMPVLCDGLLYCRNDKGTLICVDVR